MNENLNLVEILKNVPKGTKLWSPIYGEVKLLNVYTDNDIGYPIEGETKTEEVTFTADGRFRSDYPGECMLFPLKEQRDWSKFKPEPVKVKVTLHPFDRVLARDTDSEWWRIDFFNIYRDKCEEPYVCLYTSWLQCIPYNEQTAHLVGTYDPCPIDYEVTFSKEYRPM